MAYDEDDHHQAARETVANASDGLWEATYNSRSTIASDLAQALQNQAENIGREGRALQPGLSDECTTA